MMPPAMRKLARLMPSAREQSLAEQREDGRMIAATRTARIAIARRCAGVAPADSPA